MDYAHAQLQSTFMADSYPQAVPTYPQTQPRDPCIRESLSSATNSIDSIDGLISRLEDSINGPQPRPAIPPTAGQTNGSSIEPPYIGLHSHSLQIASRLSAIIGRLEMLWASI